MLHEFVVVHREEIIQRCRAKVAKRSIPPPTEAEINNGVPMFLDQLAEALRLELLSSPAIGSSAVIHGHDLRQQGFTVSQVVHDYGDVCQSITELAMEMDTRIDAGDFRRLNACLDDAIAVAVTQYATEGRVSDVREETARGNERMGFLAHELRNLINTAVLAFEVLKSGNVGVAGSTGAVLQRSLAGARDLIGRSLSEVQLVQGTQHPERLLVSTFIRDIEPTARLMADTKGVVLSVEQADEALAIDVDRAVLAAVVMNLLQNACKFTPHGTTVTLRVTSSGDRVFLEIQDECGGIPAGDIKDLFRPFEQRAEDRSGLGLGLAFSRWGTEANHGRLVARTLPDDGCVFTIDLPRASAPVASTF